MYDEFTLIDRFKTIEEGYHHSFSSAAKEIFGANNSLIQLPGIIEENQTTESGFEGMIPKIKMTFSHIQVNFFESQLLEFDRIMNFQTGVARRTSVLRPKHDHLLQVDTERFCLPGAPYTACWSYEVYCQMGKGVLDWSITWPQNNESTLWYGVIVDDEFVGNPAKLSLDFRLGSLLKVIAVWNYPESNHESDIQNIMDAIRSELKSGLDRYWDAQKSDELNDPVKVRARFDQLYAKSQDS